MGMLLLMDVVDDVVPLNVQEALELFDFTVTVEPDEIVLAPPVELDESVTELALLFLNLTV